MKSVYEHQFFEFNNETMIYEAVLIPFLKSRNSKMLLWTVEIGKDERKIAPPGSEAVLCTAYVDDEWKYRRLSLRRQKTVDFISSRNSAFARHHTMVLI